MGGRADRDTARAADISDRILVARLGRIVAEFDAADTDEGKIMYAAIH